jgi:hypothetical protein
MFEHLQKFPAIFKRADAYMPMSTIYSFVCYEANLLGEHRRVGGGGGGRRGGGEGTHG